MRKNGKKVCESVKSMLPNFMLILYAVMKEIETDDNLWKTKERKRAEKAQKSLDQANTEQTTTKATAVASPVSPVDESHTPSADRRPGFY